MYVDRIRETFQRYNYRSGSMINQQNFYHVLSQLLQGQQYDPDVAEQLWEQASRGQRNIDIDTICQTISEGISILQTKLDEINQEIRSLQRQKRDRMQGYSSGVNRSVVNKIDNDLSQLLMDRQQFEEDLRLVTIPFNINLVDRNSQALRYDSKINGAPVAGILNQSVASNRSGTRAAANDELNYILWLSIAFGVCEIIQIYIKYDFLNLIVVVSLLSIYLLNHFDNLYIKMTLILLIGSEAMDIIWLFMYAGQYWNPPTVGNYPKFMGQYLKMVVILTIAVIGIKIPIGYFVYKIKNINDAQYNISVGTFKLILQANKSNPITRNLQRVINPQ